MFTKTTEPSELDKVITQLLEDMQDTSTDTEEYAKMVDHLTKLYKLKETDLPKRVSPESWAAIAGNLAGILLILNFERAGVVTSKALGFVTKAIR